MATDTCQCVWSFLVNNSKHATCKQSNLSKRTLIVIMCKKNESLWFDSIYIVPVDVSSLRWEAIPLNRHLEYNTQYRWVCTQLLRVVYLHPPNLCMMYHYGNTSNSEFVFVKIEKSIDIFWSFFVFKCQVVHQTILKMWNSHGFDPMIFDVSTLLFVLRWFVNEYDW